MNRPVSTGRFFFALRICVSSYALRTLPDGQLHDKPRAKCDCIGKIRVTRSAHFFLSFMSRPLQILNEVFGYPAFRGQQGEIVEHVSSGGDCLVLMPTAGGKSLCYQIPSLVRREAGLGAGIVGAALIALMQDQVAALREVGVRAA